jgi:hypothetical protein
MMAQKLAGYLTMLALVVLMAATVANACPYSIRDAGFIVRDPQPYKLTVLVRGTTPETASLPAWLATAGRKELANSNVEAEFVDLATQPNHPAKAHFDKLPQKDLPCALLISPRGEAMRLLPAGGKWNAETLEELAHRTVVSPQREELARRLIGSWCVVVLAPGEDDVENRRAMQVIAEARAEVRGFRTEMGVSIDELPWVTRVFCGEPEEEVFRWGLGMDAAGESQTRVAIVWGVGRRLGPVLSGEKLTTSNLAACFKLLGENCTCTADPRSFLGPCVPLVWPQELRQQIRDQLGFDPDAPEARNVLSGVWVTLESGKMPAGDALPDPGAGYIEFPVEPGAEQPPVQEGGEPQANAGRGWERRGLRMAALVGGGITVAVGGGTAALLVLRRRRA